MPDQGPAFIQHFGWRREAAKHSESRVYLSCSSAFFAAAPISPSGESSTSIGFVRARPALGDTRSKEKIGAAGVFLGALSLVVLTWSDGGAGAMVCFAVLFACGEGINSVTWALVGDVFGRRNFATIRGWIGMLQSIASIPGAVFTGWVYDQTQSYTYALIPFIISYAVAGLVLWRLPHPTRRARIGVAARRAVNAER